MVISAVFVIVCIDFVIGIIHIVAVVAVAALEAAAASDVVEMPDKHQDTIAAKGSINLSSLHTLTNR